MKKLITIAAVLLIAGIVIAGIGFAFVKFDFSFLNSMETFTSTYYETAEFTNIEINGGSSKVTLIPWEDEECKIVCTEAEKITHTIMVSDGTLRIEKHDNRSWHEHIGVFVNEMTIEVYLPKNKYGKLRIDSSGGGVVISEGFAFSEINAESSSGGVKCYASAQVISIETSSGSIKLESVSASDIKLKASSGSISAENVRAESTFTVGSSSGSIKINGAQCGDIDVSASSGSVSAASVSCGNISAECSSGSVTVSDVIASDKMTIKTGSGSVKLKDSDAQEIDIRTGSGSVSGTLLSEKIFVTETGSGSVKVPQSFEGGKCYIKTGSGSIKISISFYE